MDEIPVWYERVPQFSKRFGDRGIKGHSLVCFVDSDGHEVRDCSNDAISDIILHCETTRVSGSRDDAVAKAEKYLEEKVSDMTHWLQDMAVVDLVVVSVLDTVITVVGDTIQCVSMFTVEGY